MPSIPFATTITVTPQTRDVRTGDRTAGSGTDVSGCAVWATPGVEQTDDQDTVVYDLTILAPAGTSVSATDRITIDSDEYEVTAQPIAWRSPLTGREPGVEIHVRRVVG